LNVIGTRKSLFYLAKIKKDQILALYTLKVKRLTHMTLLWKTSIASSVQGVSRVVKV
jgi:hypothetical protein